MKRRCILFATLAILAFFMTASAQSFVAWEKLTIQEKRTALLAQTSELVRCTGKEGVVSYWREKVTQLPGVGIGVYIGAGYRPKEDKTFEAGIWVEDVFFNSPAYKAGIVPMSFVLSIEGKKFPLIPVKESEIDSPILLKKLQTMADEALETLSKNNPVNLELDLFGMKLNRTVSKAEFGKELAIFFNENKALWDTQMQICQERLTQLNKSIPRADLEDLENFRRELAVMWKNTEDTEKKLEQYILTQMQTINIRAR